MKSLCILNLYGSRIPYQMSIYFILQCLINEECPKQNALSEDTQAKVSTILNAGPSSPSLKQSPSAVQKTTKLAFEEGPCPCTNGTIKSKSSIKTPKESSSEDGYTQRHLLASRISSCYDGEGDSLLIADLSSTCSKVS